MRGDARPDEPRAVPRANAARPTSSSAEALPYGRRSDLIAVRSSIAV
jgi:hypothetical protein